MSDLISTETQTCLLLALPPELRTMIYDLLIPQGSCTFVVTTELYADRTVAEPTAGISGLRILVTCKALRAETYPMVYAKRMFRFRLSCDDEALEKKGYRWIGHIRDQAWLKHVRYTIVGFYEAPSMRLAYRAEKFVKHFGLFCNVKQLRFTVAFKSEGEPDHADALVMKLMTTKCQGKVWVEMKELAREHIWEERHQQMLHHLRA